jgi:hypothetical protein
MEGFAHKDYVAAALTTLQIEERSGVWQPPSNTSELVSDICTRFCGLNRDDAASFVAKFVPRLNGCVPLTRSFTTISSLMDDFGFDVRQALHFCQAILWLEVHNHVLRKMKISQLEAIVQGAEIK